MIRSELSAIAAIRQDPRLVDGRHFEPVKTRSLMGYGDSLRSSPTLDLRLSCQQACRDKRLRLFGRLQRLGKLGSGG
jgi:hypothetical protein